MDRAWHPIESVRRAAAPDFDLDSALFSTGSPDTSCAQFVPLHYEAGYAYPLVVWLHGRGNDERQLMRIMPMVSMRNFIAIAPRGTCASDLSQGASYEWRQSRSDIQRAEQRIFDGIAMAREKFNIAPRRIFLAGFDCGGTMAFRVAMSHPSRFAGVLSCCGPFPHGYTPLGNLTEARKLPVLLAVGRDSSEYQPDEVCENLRLLHTAGLSITLRQYPSGHELSAQMLADVDHWIIEQITSEGRCDTQSDRRRQYERD